MTLQAYQSVRRTTLLEGASPHQLIEMLYDGALSNIAIARKHMASGNRQLLHAHVDKAVAIVQELQASLRDFETDELAGNLFELYRYIVNTLLDGQANLDDEALGICAHLIDILRDAWQAIAPEKIAA
ncbi:MAG: flagellar export chaperone FliS [Granulosicoccus sp.]|nr:flagellar export chaperone FliS [Granulosicoccus sp.]